MWSFYFAAFILYRKKMSSLQRHGGWSGFSNCFSRQQSSSLSYQPRNDPQAHNVDNQGFLRAHRNRGYITPIDYPVNNPNTGAPDQRLPQRDRGYITPINYPVNYLNTGAHDRRDRGYLTPINYPINNPNTGAHDQRDRGYLTPISGYPGYLQPANGRNYNYNTSQ